MRVIAVVVLALLLGFTAFLGYQSFSAELEADDRNPVALAEGRTDAPVEGRLLSARRLPDEMADATLERRLKAYLDPLEATIPEGSCLAVSRLNGTVVASTRSTLPLTPASTLKLVTAYGILSQYEPEHRFVTEILALELPADGIVPSDIWVRGVGDPLLMTTGYAEAFSRQPQKHTPLASVAEAMRDAGILEVLGQIIGDESRYDQERYNPSWPERYITQNNTGPLSGLSVNDGFSRYDPARHASDPAEWAASAIRDELRQLDIDAGGASSGTAPPEAVVIATVESLPVGEIIAEMLEESDNSTAELLTKEIGTLGGSVGTTAGGLDVTLGAVDTLQADSSQVVLIDGSGLDPTNKVTCDLLANVLVVSGTDSAIGNGLAVVGETGTLAHRFPDTPLAGHLRAKTGFINTVTGLAGFIETTGGEELVFSLISNDLSVEGTEGFDLQEQVSLKLYSSPGPPRVDDLAP